MPKSFLKTTELGKKNATDELYSSSKWPFEQADMNINWILVYWDDGNSLPNILVIPFKDGVTFVVMTAIQSLQRCYLENVADVTYVAVTKCDFWNIFLNFWIENAHTSGPEAIGWHRGSKQGPKHGSTIPKIIEVCNCVIWEVTYVAATKCHFWSNFSKILNWKCI